MTTTPPLPTSEPRALVAGDNWKWTRDIPNYSFLDGYTLKYFLRGSGGTLDIIAVQDPNNLRGFLVNVAGGTTAPLPGGTYTFQAAMFDSGGNRTEVHRGTLEIKDNIQTQAATYDGRSYVKKTLDAIRNVILGTASKEDAEYQIGQRSLKRRNLKELQQLESRFAYLYRKEQIASGEYNGPSNSVEVRFGRDDGSSKQPVRPINVDYQ